MFYPMYKDEKIRENFFPSKKKNQKCESINNQNEKAKTKILKEHRKK